MSSLEATGALGNCACFSQILDGILSGNGSFGKVCGSSAVDTCAGARCTKSGVSGHAINIGSQMNRVELFSALIIHLFCPQCATSNLYGTWPRYVVKDLMLN